MKIELTEQIRSIIEELDRATTDYVFSKYPNGNINEEDDNVKAYRSLAPFVEDYLG